MKVFVVFSGVDDYDGLHFEAVCDSLESANSFIENKVTAEARGWHWMEKKHQDNNIERMKKEYRADETEVLSLVAQ